MKTFPTATALVIGIRTHSIRLKIRQRPLSKEAYGIDKNLPAYDSKLGS